MPVVLDRQGVLVPAGGRGRVGGPVAEQPGQVVRCLGGEGERGAVDVAGERGVEQLEPGHRGRVFGSGGVAGEVVAFGGELAGVVGQLGAADQVGGQVVAGAGEHHVQPRPAGVVDGEGAGGVQVAPSALCAVMA
jgi:hypothetical protein